LPEARGFCIRIVDIFVWHPVQGGGRKYHHRFAERHAPSAGYALQKQRARQRVVAESLQHLADFHLVDAAGQLRGQRHQERLFVGGVFALLALLRHQHAQHPATADDRHADETVERRLARGGNVTKGGMSRRVFDVDRFGPAGGQTGEPLTEFESHLADCARTQAVGAHQHMLVPAVIGHVD